MAFNPEEFSLKSKDGQKKLIKKAVTDGKRDVFKEMVKRFGNFKFSADLTRSVSYHPWDLLYVACLNDHIGIVEDILETQRSRKDMEVNDHRYG